MVLSDSDDTGLEVDTKALLVASGPGTSGNTFYADSDRGGNDTPLDGELGISESETNISRFRRFNTTVLLINDNDSPAPLGLTNYYGSGGPGNDLTIYLRTMRDGEVSFPVASQFISAGGGYINFTLPSNAQNLLNNLTTGDRWIFKAARAATSVVVQTGTGEVGEVTSTGIEGAGNTPAVKETGSGELGNVNTSGIEGTGRAIQVVTRTGAGEVGIVTTSGIEGSGIAESPIRFIEQEFDLGNFAPSSNWFGSILIDPVFVVGGAAAYLRELSRSGTAPRIRTKLNTYRKPR